MGSSNKRVGAPALVAAIVASLLTMAGPATAVEPACADAATKGCWSDPFSENGDFDAAPPATVEEAGRFPTAASIVVSPKGRIVYWDGLAGLEDSNVSLSFDAGRTATPDRTRILDLSDGDPEFTTPSPEYIGENLFCSDQRLLADGRLIVAGGTKYQTEPYADFPDEVADPDAGAPDGLAELYGSADTRVFRDSSGDGGGWSLDPAMAMRWRRWYPTLITLANGKLLAASGVSKLLWNSNAIDDDNPKNSIAEAPVNVKETEVFDPVTSRWTDNANAESEQSLPLYTRLHLLPNGEVLYSGDGQMWGPAGEDINELGWNWQKIFDPAAAAWRDANLGPFGARNGASSVLLPLRPDADGNYDSAEVLVAGGTLGVSPGLYLGTQFTEKISLSDGDDDGHFEATSERVGDLNNARWFSTGVALPNGEVLILNGGDKDEVIMPGTEQSVRTPELWNGSGWVELADGARDRTYHNSAILLADGSVLVGGHAPVNYGYGGQGDNSAHNAGLGANNFRDPSFERFYPPYLYAGARPELLNSAKAGTYGAGLPFETEAGADVAKVVLSRLPAQTHTTDADARTVEVAFTQNPEQSVQIDSFKAHIPSNSAALPPGYYYLFAMSSQGVPSIATIVKIDFEVEGAGIVTPVELGGQPPVGGTTTAATVPSSRGTSSAPVIAADVAAAAPAAPLSNEPRVPMAWLLAVATVGVAAIARRNTARSRA